MGVCQGAGRTYRWRHSPATPGPGGPSPSPSLAAGLARGTAARVESTIAADDAEQVPRYRRATGRSRQTWTAFVSGKRGTRREPPPSSVEDRIRPTRGARDFERRGTRVRSSLSGETSDARASRWHGPSGVFPLREVRVLDGRSPAGIGSLLTSGTSTAERGTAVVRAVFARKAPVNRPARQQCDELDDGAASPPASQSARRSAGGSSSER